MSSNLTGQLFTFGQAHLPNTVRQAASRNHACLAFCCSQFSWLVVSCMACSMALLEEGSQWAWSNNLNELPRTSGQAPFKHTSAIQSGRQPQDAMHAATKNFLADSTLAGR